MKYILSFIGVVTICLSIFLFKDNQKLESFQIEVVANSLSAEDQSIKKEVERAILSFLQENKTHQGTNFSFENNLQSFQDISMRVLRNSGVFYGCSVSLQTEILPTDSNTNFVFEAGGYEKVIIFLGKANG